MAFSKSAFVTAALPLSASGFTARQAVSSRPSFARPATRVAPSAILGSKKPETETAAEPDRKFNRIEQDRAAKIDAVDTDPQGFTTYSEIVNGRLAMIFLLVGVITEIASGKTIAEQILILGSPITVPLMAIISKLS